MVLTQNSSRIKGKILNVQKRFFDKHMTAWAELFLKMLQIEIPCQKVELKVHSCKLCNDKYTIASTHLRNTEIFAITF